MSIIDGYWYPIILKFGEQLDNIFKYLMYEI